MTLRRYGALGAALLVAAVAVPVANAGEALTCFGEPVTIVGTNTNDKLIGTAGDDVIHGVDGRDQIYGRGGNDLLCGGNGSGDHLRGEKGRDKLDGGLQKDHLFGGTGNDFLMSTGDSGPQSYQGDHAHGGKGNDHFAGSLFNDHFYPGPGDDSLDGGDTDKRVGIDTIHLESAPGRVWVDFLAGTARGEGRDTLVGVEAVYGTRFDDILLGDDAAYNRFYGFGGDDLFSGRGGTDFFDPDFDDRTHLDNPGAGDDRMFGGDGNDKFYLYNGDDEVRGENGHDFVDATGSGQKLVTGGPGQDGIDFVNAGATYADLREQRARADGGQYVLKGFEDLFGSRKADKLFGDDGPNRIFGQANDDLILGRGGDDNLDGQAYLSVGNKIDGGDGIDRCVRPSTTGGAKNCETTE